MSAGGQPFQVIYLKNKGLSGSAALSVPMGRYVVSQLVFVLMSTVVMILVSTTNIAGSTNVVSVAFYVGYSLNLFVVLLVGFLSMSKSVGKKIVVGVLVIVLAVLVGLFVRVSIIRNRRRKRRRQKHAQMKQIGKQE